MKEEGLGLAPGTLVAECESPVFFRVFVFSDKGIVKKQADDLGEIVSILRSKKFFWLQVFGLGEVYKIRELGEVLDINMLTLEDVLDLHHRPKVQDMGNFQFLTFREFSVRGGKIDSSQISLLAHENFLVSFSSDGEDIFDPLVKRFEGNRKDLMKFKSSYLMYSILDFFVDQYFLVEACLEETIESLAKKIMKREPDFSIREDLYDARIEFLHFQKYIFPLVEILDRMIKHPACNPKGHLQFYLDDVRDHVVKTLEFIKSYSDVLDGLLSLYFSATSEKTNKVVQFLTVITIIFLPLTLIAGIYGMNFEYMPELAWRWGYFVILGGMLVLAVGILYCLKRKKWL